MAASRAGLDVVGFDIDQDRVDALTSGTSHVEDVDDEEFGAALGAGIEFTTLTRPTSTGRCLVVAAAGATLG